MEELKIIFDDAMFDNLVHKGLAQAGPIHVAMKDKATQQGSPGAVISWLVKMPDGSLAGVQATTTVKLLIALGKALEGRYGQG